MSSLLFFIIDLLVRVVTGKRPQVVIPQAQATLPNPAANVQVDSMLPSVSRPLLTNSFKESVLNEAILSRDAQSKAVAADRESSPIPRSKTHRDRRSPQRGSNQRSLQHRAIERRHIGPNLARRTKQTEVLAAGKLLAESASTPKFDANEICEFLNHGRVRELLEVKGLSPDVVARIFDARQHKSFKSLEDAQRRINGFYASHLENLAHHLSEKN